ncbi:hypothetical protein [Methyloversatilis sp.]|uniref:hypothetical protein n=1 Tax=Methyloversatilis sp. TaxID=2569862 RepID=UPI003F730713
MSDIYKNAVDSLRFAIEHFLKEPTYSSRKHAILTLFHAVELFLKEQLFRTNRLLIYRNIDSPVTEDSQTVGIKEALSRLENLGLGLPKQQRGVIENIQKRRNRIEHHRYDQKEEDEVVIAESLQFILFFVDSVLRGKLEEDIPAETLREIQRIVYERDQLYWIAMHRLERWMHEEWPDWNDQVADTPDEFAGTNDCPICRDSFLVSGYHPKPFCFRCNTTVDAEDCNYCGRTYIAGNPCHTQEE